MGDFHHVRGVVHNKFRGHSGRCFRLWKVIPTESERGSEQAGRSLKAAFMAENMEQQMRAMEHPPSPGKDAL